MRVLITGSNGQLGSEIRDLAADFKELDCVFKGLPDLDICNFEALQTYVKDHNISAVVNCAAYTAVDKAEQEPETARMVNFKGVSNLVAVLETIRGKLIHISTDYVFDGNQQIPYKETDPVSPIGVYGITKREGELAVVNSKIDAIVIRTSWLYSSYGDNFVKTMLRLGNEKQTLGVVVDQIGTPTYAKDLAKICLEILCKNTLDKIGKEGKLYHYSNEGVASWYDFATAVMELGGVNCKVTPIQTKDYPTPSKRPHYSVLSKLKIKKKFHLEIPYWRNSLKNCIEKIKNQE